MVLAGGLGAAHAAQEREVPRDSERLTLPGCARGRTFVTASTAAHEAARSGVSDGRRFRMTGSRKLLDEIEARKGRMIELTGLVRKAHLGDPGGISVAGGRIRIGGRMPQAGVADPRYDPAYSQAVIDVEAWRPLPDACPPR
jgi:hypothetical protein